MHAPAAAVAIIWCRPVDTDRRRIGSSNCRPVGSAAGWPAIWSPASGAVAAAAHAGRRQHDLGGTTYGLLDISSTLLNTGGKHRWSKQRVQLVHLTPDANAQKMCLENGRSNVLLRIRDACHQPAPEGKWGLVGHWYIGQHRQGPWGMARCVNMLFLRAWARSPQSA